MKSVLNLEKLNGKRVLVRVDFNVDLVSGKIKDDYRIRSILPTINHLKKEGARIILISHFTGEGNSLLPVSRYSQRFFKHQFAKDFDELSYASQAGDCIVMLENLRNWSGEESNDTSFVQKLASTADIFVNEAFPVSHRKHASIVGLPKYLPSYAGIRFLEEIKELSKSFNPPKPFIFVLGGAKFETKIPLVEKFLKKADKVFIGGALANDILKEQGLEIGKSKVSGGNLDLSKIIESEKVILPVDVVTDGPDGSLTKDINDVLPVEKIFDAGPKTIEFLSDEISKARFVLWNGPFGNYEDGFVDATKQFARDLSKVKAETIIGGGDTLTAITDLGILKNFSFVSTGGGAMLEFLANETLPGIQSLES